MRNQGLSDRIARAESDLFEYKNAQIFGRDVTAPKVIQRYNADGTPTTWDVIGTYDYDGYGNSYKASGIITYTAETQESPWATIYAEVMVNPQGVLKQMNSISFSAYPEMDDVFSGQKSIRFNFYGVSDDVSPTTAEADPTVDRFYLKLYALATDYGTLRVEIPAGFFANGYEGTGTVVPTS